MCGLSSESIQRKLLTERDLTLVKAFEVAQGMEKANTLVPARGESEAFLVQTFLFCRKNSANIVCRFNVLGDHGSSADAGVPAKSEQ